MNLYKLGLDAGTTWFPSVAEPLRNQAGEIVAGLSMVHRGGTRMYEVGALQKQASLAPGLPGVVEWGKDLGMGALLLIGLFVTVGALSKDGKANE